MGRASRRTPESSTVATNRIRTAYTSSPNVNTPHTQTLLMNTSLTNTYSDTAAIATIDQFKAALLAVRDWSGISPTQLQMLQAQCRAPDCTITAMQLADQLCFKNVAAARLHYGTFARAIADRLGYAPPAEKGKPCWWFTLSTGRDDHQGLGDGSFEWVMRPELVAALHAMKWA